MGSHISERTTVPCPAAAQAAARPAAPALIEPGRTWTYAEAECAIASAAAPLARSGIGPGDRVALWDDPSPDYLWRIFALMRLGAVACPLSTRLPVAGLADSVARLSPAALITNRLETADAIHCPVLNLPSQTGPDATRYPGATGAATLDTAGPATVIFTSGSSGAPRPAVHRLGNHLASALASNQRVPLGPGDRWLLSLPLYHVGGLAVMFRCFLAGAAVTMPPAGMPLTQSISELNPTHVSVVATQLQRLCSELPGNLAGFKAVLLGGGPAPIELIAEARDVGMPVHTSYGMTETASQIATTLPGSPLSTLQTAGPPLLRGTIRIADDGEIQVRGATLFLGYFEQGAPRLPLTPCGWFQTGDLGAWDAHGNLIVLGRKDNMFISGGENIHPEEIEQRLCALDGVAQAVVVSVPHPEFGQQPVAFVDTGGRPLDPAALAARLGAVLPRFKVPKTYLPWPGDSTPPGFKPDRAALARRALEAMDRRALNRPDTAG